MGRYAFFSTGFEYKFWFGLQNSLDILNFGGTSRNSRGEDGAIEWTFHFDYDQILQQLSRISRSSANEIETFLRKQETGTHGTHTVLLESSQFEKYPQEPLDQARFCLGLVIAHQLTYSPSLMCTFEI